MVAQVAQERHHQLQGHLSLERVAGVALGFNQMVLAVLVAVGMVVV
jgi:hypothetical protein